ncbi:hypothetical protein Q9Q99_04155 [Curtobacterium flaccumfaciens]|nr:hypothetical protein Q9Q99_04155 [Curtobacterium flaccumfaciens]
MARWAPEETDTMAAIAAEAIAQVGTNRTVIGIDGQDGTDLERVAAALCLRVRAARGLRHGGRCAVGRPGHAPG